jgi:hypothetical protein
MNLTISLLCLIAAHREEVLAKKMLSLIPTEESIEALQDHVNSTVLFLADLKAEVRRRENENEVFQSALREFSNVIPFRRP